MLKKNERSFFLTLYSDILDMAALQKSIDKRNALIYYLRFCHI